jgi:phytoene/squalene synthetase
MLMARRRPTRWPLHCCRPSKRTACRARRFADMIDARIFDLYDDPIETRVSLEGYAGETASALIQLASLVLSPDEAPQSAEAAGHAGVAQAIAGCCC